MLPADPILRGRVLRAARTLVDWSQARLACEACISRATVNAVETGRMSRECPACLAMVGALECAGVQFIPPIGHLGPGVRFTLPDGLRR